MIPGISILKVTVPNVRHSGTNSPIKMKFFFANGKTCSTGVLDNIGNDFKRESLNIYNANNLGACYDLDVDEDDLFVGQGQPYIQVKAISEGGDWLLISSIEFSANLAETSQRFNCDLPSSGIGIEYSSSPKLNCYKMKDTFDSRSIHAIEILPASSSKKLSVSICTDNGLKCCQTSAFYHVSAGKTAQVDGALLRDCHGFKIQNDTYSVSVVETGNGNVIGSLLYSVSIYNSRLKYMTPMDTCLTEGGSKSHVSCKVPTEFQVNSLRFGVCDKTHSGTDSSISVQISSNGRSCDTGILDKAGNDFEKSDWMHYKYHEISRECQDFPISTTDLRVHITNAGNDALCLDRFQILTDGNHKVLNCYLPLMDPNDEFWVEAQKLVVTCD